MVLYDRSIVNNMPVGQNEYYNLILIWIVNYFLGSIYTLNLDQIQSLYYCRTQYFGVYSAIFINERVLIKRRIDPASLFRQCILCGDKLPCLAHVTNSVRWLDLSLYYHTGILGYWYIDILKQKKMYEISGKRCTHVFNVYTSPVNCFIRKQHALFFKLN